MGKTSQGNPEFRTHDRRFLQPELRTVTCSALDEWATQFPDITLMQFYKKNFTHGKNKRTAIEEISIT